LKRQKPRRAIKRGEKKVDVRKNPMGQARKTITEKTHSEALPRGCPALVAAISETLQREKSQDAEKGKKRSHEGTLNRNKMLNEMNKEDS